MWRLVSMWSLWLRGRVMCISLGSSNLSLSSIIWINLNYFINMNINTSQNKKLISMKSKLKNHNKNHNRSNRKKQPQNRIKLNQSILILILITSTSYILFIVPTQNNKKLKRWKTKINKNRKVRMIVKRLRMKKVEVI